MSKLATILSASVFFGLALLVSSGKPRRDVLLTIHHVNFVYKCIANRAAIIGYLIPSAISLPINEEFSGLVMQLKQNMTSYANWTRLMVDRVLNDSNNKNIYDETMCKSYLLEYEREIESIENKLTGHMNNALNDTMTKLLEVLNVCNIALNNVHKLKSDANSCVEHQCYDIRHFADNTLHDVFAITSSFTCADDHLANHMQILIRMENDLYIEKGLSIIRDTQRCTLSGKFF